MSTDHRVRAAEVHRCPDRRRQAASIRLTVVDVVDWWIVAPAVTPVVGIVAVAVLVQYGYSRRVVLPVIALTLAVMAALIAVGYYWAITEGHLAG